MDLLNVAKSKLQAMAQGIEAIAQGSTDTPAQPVDRDEERTSLFQKTSDAVKALQRAFAGKSDLATSENPTVTCLCAQLERVFCHGIKPKKKPVEYTFWPMLSDLLESSEVARFSSLQNINTDSGKDRAWIRASLNEQLFQKYLKRIAEEADRIRPHYEDYAFLLDEEKCNMLGMLCVGLETTLFALDVDDASLNSPRSSLTASSAPATRPVSIAPPAPSEAADTPAAFIAVHEHTAHESVEVVKKKKSKKDKEKEKEKEKKSRRKKSATVAEINEMMDGGDNGADAGTAADDASAQQQPQSLAESPERSTPSADGEDAREGEALSISPAASAPIAIGGGRNGSLSTGGGDGDSVSLLESFAPSSVDSQLSLVTRPQVELIAPQRLATVAAQDEEDEGEGASTEAPIASSTLSLAAAALAATQRSVSALSTSPSRASPKSRTSPLTRMVSAGSASGGDEGGMTAEELREVLLGVMRAKDDLDAELRSTRAALAETSAVVAQLTMEAQVAQVAREEVKARFQEATDEHVRTIQSLTKENNLLKQQLKKYVTEAQELKRRALELEEAHQQHQQHQQSAPVVVAPVVTPAPASPKAAKANQQAEKEEDEDELSGGEEDESYGGFPSVEAMQEHHEHQVLQLAAMHTDLIELNERLQAQLRDRETLIAALGGVVPNEPAFVPSSAAGGAGGVPKSKGLRPARITPDDAGICIPGTNKPILNIWIPTALLQGKGSDAFHVYQIFVQIGGEEWNVYRRYTHFYDLHRQVQHIFTDADLRLPKKSTLSKNNPKFVEKRRIALENYIRQVLLLCLSQKRSPLVQNPCKQTLCEAVPFLKEKLSSGADATPAATKGASYSGL